MDRSIVENSSGSWSINVTGHMQSLVALFGEASGGNPVDSKYDLTVTAGPPCALPIIKIAPRGTSTLLQIDGKLITLGTS